MLSKFGIQNVVKMGSRRQTLSSFSLAKRAFATKTHFYDILQLDETRADLRETIEKFADEEVKPLADEMDKTMVFPQ